MPDETTPPTLLELSQRAKELHDLYSAAKSKAAASAAQAAADASDADVLHGQVKTALDAVIAEAVAEEGD